MSQVTFAVSVEGDRCVVWAWLFVYNTHTVQPLCALLSADSIGCMTIASENLGHVSSFSDNAAVCLVSVG
jgi:hypothetical protein